MQIGIFKKSEQKDLCDMNKTEKKCFLACDLIERMIRIEQKVRGSMGEGLVPYYKTEYFKELHSSEKNKFLEYLKGKEVKKKWKFLPFVLIPGLGSFIGLKVTGNVIAEEQGIQPINLILLGVFLVAVVAYWIYVLSKRRRFKRLDRHFNVLERIIAKRKLRR
ncbi:MAG: hypothetical protein WCI72_06895 [archaeon]